MFYRVLYREIFILGRSCSDVYRARTSYVLYYIPTFNITICRSTIKYTEKIIGKSGKPEIKCPGSI